REDFGVNAERDGRVEEARAIDVDFEAAVARRLTQSGHFGGAGDRAPRGIMRILDCQQGRPREVDVFGSDRTGDLVWRHLARFSDDSPQREAAKPRSAAYLGVCDVRT